MRVVSIAVATLALLISAASAEASSFSSSLTLDDLVGDGITLASRDHKLIFSNFQVEISGGSQDLSEYRVQALGNGFKLFGESTGPQVEFLDITLSYDVATAQENLVLTAMAVASLGWNKFGGNLVDVDAFNRTGDQILDERRDTRSKKMKYKFWRFSEVASSASVVESIRIDKTIKGDRWHLKRRFKTGKVEPGVVPEPNTALMLGLGMIGLASYAQRKANSAKSA